MLLLLDFWCIFSKNSHFSPIQPTR